MQQTENYFCDILRTFDGRTHKVTAWRVGGTWRAHVNLDGQMLRGKSAKTLAQAIANFRVRYQTAYDR
jgi:hypothetical protein